MFLSNSHDQIIIKVALDGYLAVNAESFLIGRQSSGLSKHSLKFYRNQLSQFVTYCNSNAFTQVEQITSDFLRRYFLAYSEKHN